MSICNRNSVLTFSKKQLLQLLNLAVVDVVSKVGWELDGSISKRAEGEKHGIEKRGGRGKGGG